MRYAIEYCAKRSALMREIQKHGIVQPIIADRKTYLVRDGAQRVFSALLLALAEVPVIFVDLPDEAFTWRDRT